MRIRYLKFLAALVIILATSAATVGYHIWTRPGPNLDGRQVVAWVPGDAVDGIEGHGSGQAVRLVETLARPVFRRSRRPFDADHAAHVEVAVEQLPVAAVLEVAPAPDASHLVLKGVLLDSTQERALIASTEQPEGIWLSRGATIAGWTLDALGEEAVILSAGRQRVELKLYVDNLPK